MLSKPYDDFGIYNRYVESRGMRTMQEPPTVHPHVAILKLSKVISKNLSAVEDQKWYAHEAGVPVDWLQDDFPERLKYLPNHKKCSAFTTWDEGDLIDLIRYVWEHELNRRKK